MPAKFRFNLQTVLEQRERAERSNQLLVAEIERERIGVEQRLRLIQSQIAVSRDDLRRTLGGEVLVADVRMQAGATLNLEVRARQAALELAGVLRRLEAARAELLKAATGRKAVASLKDKRLAEWKLDLARRESNELDEMTVMRHGRGSASA